MKQPVSVPTELLRQAGCEPGESRQWQCACGAGMRLRWWRRSMTGHGYSTTWRFEDTVTLGGAVTYGRVDGKDVLVCRRCKAPIGLANDTDVV